MSGFSAQWLALREPADHAARSNPEPVQWLLSAMPADRPLRILDLACGTGSNLRCLAPQLVRAQHWTLLDHDAALLAACPAALQRWMQITEPPFEITHACRQLDLAAQLDSLDFAAFDLVTTTALLDLVSADWLARLATKCRDARVAVLFALTYDGRMQFEPGWAQDALVSGYFNRHQRTGKGFGTALGPDAAATAQRLFADAGYDVQVDTTDWVLKRDHRHLQTELVTGCAVAAAEMAPGEKALIDSWCRQRLSYIATGHSRIRVGHLDIAGRWPAAKSADLPEPAPGIARTRD